MKNHSASVCISFLLLLLALGVFGCSRREPYLSSDPENVLDQTSLLKGRLSGTLKLENSPFRVSGDIEVDSLSTLTIEPGVTIFFSDSSKLTVKGKLIAEGRPYEPIWLTAKTDKWNGIRVLNSRQGSVFGFCIIEKAAILQNPAAGEDGAFHIDNSTVTIHNSIIRNNNSVNGGGIFIKNSEAELRNNIFTGNHAGVFGGAVLAAGSALKFINNTVYNNSSENYGGGLVILDEVNSQAENNIFYKNTGRSGDPRIAVSGDTTGAVLRYNFLSYGSMSPLFKSEGNFHLAADSPCINAGNPEASFNDADNSRNDQGAYGGPLGNW